MQRQINQIIPYFRLIKTLSNLTDVFVSTVELKIPNAERKGPWRVFFCRIVGSSPPRPERHLISLRILPSRDDPVSFDYTGPFTASMGIGEHIKRAELVSDWEWPIPPQADVCRFFIYFSLPPSPCLCSSETAKENWIVNDLRTISSRRRICMYIDIKYRWTIKLSLMNNYINLGFRCFKQKSARLS